MDWERTTFQEAGLGVFQIRVLPKLPWMAIQLIKSARNWLLKRTFHSGTTFQGAGLWVFQIGCPSKLPWMAMHLIKSARNWPLWIDYGGMFSQ